MPGGAEQQRYVPLVAKGLIRLAAGEVGRIPTYDVPDDVSPLDLLLAERAEDDR